MAITRTEKIFIQVTEHDSAKKKTSQTLYFGDFDWFLFKIE
jgi:hypothetical protein